MRPHEKSHVLGIHAARVVLVSTAVVSIARHQRHESHRTVVAMQGPTQGREGREGERSRTVFLSMNKCMSTEQRGAAYSAVFALCSQMLTAQWLLVEERDGGHHRINHCTPRQRVHSRGQNLPPRAYNQNASPFSPSMSI